MKINAIIESKDGGTLVLDFPRSIYDVYEKLQSVGIRQSPHQITLSDEEGDDVRVKLYSEDEIGKHLLLTLKEHNSLADANMLAFMVDNAIFACGSFTVLGLLPPFLRREWNMLIDLTLFAFGHPAGGSMLAVADCLGFDVVEAVYIRQQCDPAEDAEHNGSNDDQSCNT